jgi:hypothetical protein
MTELDLQKFAIDLLRKTAAPGVIYFHCPNGAPTSAKIGARMKAMGLLAGVADLIIVRPGGLVYFLELKTAKGSLSTAQRAFRDVCEANGVPYAVAINSERVEAILRGWGALRSVASMPTRKAA